MEPISKLFQEKPFIYLTENHQGNQLWSGYKIGEYLDEIEEFPNLKMLLIDKLIDFIRKNDKNFKVDDFFNYYWNSSIGKIKSRNES